MKISQQIILRDKVRRRKFRNSYRAFMKTGKIIAALVLSVYSTHTVYNFLFRDDFFLIKSVVADARSPLAAKIESDLKPLLGRSILLTAAGRLETELQKKYPEILNIRIERKLPDGIRVAYALREPAAFVRGGKNAQGIDLEGQRFPLPKEHSQPEKSLPELVLNGLSQTDEPLQFIQAWRGVSGSFSQNESWKLSKVTVDKYGEISAELASAEGPQTMTLSWGLPEQKHFSEKFMRLKQVRDDLNSRNLQPKFIDMAGVPHSKGAERVLVGIRKGAE